MPKAEETKKEEVVEEKKAVAKKPAAAKKTTTKKVAEKKETVKKEAGEKKETAAKAKTAKAKPVKEEVVVSKASPSEKIRIRLKAYDNVILDQSAEKIVDTAKRTGATVSGPIPLPTKREVVTIIRSPHKHKDSREQFEMKTHKRVIDILYPTQTTIDNLMKLDLPAGVDIEIKL